MLTFHKRLKMSVDHELDVAVARENGDVILGVGRPLAAETDMPSLRPFENMLVIPKRLKILAIFLLNMSLYILATLLFV